MSESKFKILEIFNLMKLAEISDVSYRKLYNRKTGETTTDLSLKEATKIANGIKKGLDPLFKKLGFTIQVTRAEDSPLL